MGGKRLAEPEYTTIKQLLAKGYGGNKVAEIIGRGVGTVSTVKNSKDYQDYKTRRERPAEQPITEQVEFNVGDDKRSNIFVAINRVIDAIYDYQTELDDMDLLSKEEAKVIELASQKLEEARMWLKTYL